MEWPPLLPSWLWIVFTLVASSAQTARNAMQRDLTTSVGTQGATYVRFLFGFPFALIFLIVLRFVTGEPFPVPDLRAFGWAFAGSMSQVAATALMLMAMRDRSFLVTIAYTKTEAILVALFSIVFLGEHPTPMVAVAILVATAGVILMSWPKGADASTGEKQNWRPAMIGLASGASFGLSATCYRGSVLALPSKSFIMTATMTLFLGLLIQCVLIIAWLSLRDRALLKKIIVNWRPSLLAGMMGAFASEFWFLAFAISSATKVRTLALVEVPMAHVVSRRVFKQGMSRADIAGTALIVVGVILLING
jgi:drug/metabolite transporter (DMT)-like permease